MERKKEHEIWRGIVDLLKNKIETRGMTMRNNQQHLINAAARNTSNVGLHALFYFPSSRQTIHGSQSTMKCSTSGPANSTTSTNKQGKKNQRSRERIKKIEERNKNMHRLNNN